MKSETNPASIPFSISPDAEDYLRDRLSQMPPGARLVLVMTMSQTDGLDRPRWLYEGQSFIIGDLEPNKNATVKHAEFKLFDRRLAIEPDALKQLSGQTLNLRRIPARYGLMKNPRYVLVASAAQEPSAARLEAMAALDKARRVFSIAGLVVLGGFTGMGAAWIVGSAAVVALKIPAGRFLPLTFPLFVTGRIAGAISSFFFFRFVFKTRGRTRFIQEQTERKYLGSSGLEGNLDWWAFVGLPISITVLLISILEPFARTVGQKTGFAAGAIMVTFAASLYFSDRLPQRLIFWLGIVGWVLILVVGYWYFKTHGP